VVEQLRAVTDHAAGLLLSAQLLHNRNRRYRRG
jgi:hypothetical protein